MGVARKGGAWNAVAAFIYDTGGFGSSWILGGRAASTSLAWIVHDPTRSAKTGGHMYIDQVGNWSIEPDFLAVCGFSIIGLLVSLRVVLEFPAMAEMAALL